MFQQLLLAGALLLLSKTLFATVKPSLEYLTSQSDVVACAVLEKIQRKPYSGTRTNGRVPLHEWVFSLRISRILKGKLPTKTLEIAYPVKEELINGLGEGVLNEEEIRKNVLGKEREFFLRRRLSSSAIVGPNWKLSDFWFGMDTCPVSQPTK